MVALWSPPRREYPYPFSVAPMMQVTDQHWRFMARGLTRRTLLYTEMVVDQTLLYNRDGLARFIGHNTEEAPVAVQLGGNDPESLGQATEIVRTYFGSACLEINLNCGCPSYAVAGRHCFGARLMAQPDLVRRLVSEMVRRSGGTRITVKHRLGTDLSGADYATTRAFCMAAREGGVSHFVVHTRMAVLGRRISTEQNRSVPPLDHDVAHRLSVDMPDCTFVINGGLKTLDDCARHLNRPDSLLAGAMVGRAAWTAPTALLARADTSLLGANADPCYDSRQLIDRYADYADRTYQLYDESADFTLLFRPLYYIFRGVNGSKRFRGHLVRTSRLLRMPEDQPPSEHISDALRHIPNEIVDRPFPDPTAHIRPQDEGDEAHLGFRFCVDAGSSSEIYDRHHVTSDMTDAPFKPLSLPPEPLRPALLTSSS